MRAARTLFGFGVALAVAGAASLSAQAPTPASQTTRLGRCFTPASHAGVYFEVTADGPLAEALRQGPPRHRQVHVTALGRVQVPDTDTLELAEEQLSVGGPRRHALPVHRIGIRSDATSPLLTPVPLTTSTMHSRASHRHSSIFDLSPLSDPSAVDVVLTTTEGTTGCRLKFR